MLTRFTALRALTVLSCVCSSSLSSAADEQTPGHTPYETMSQADLEAELEESNLGGGIALTAVGGGLTLLGTGLLVIGQLIKSDCVFDTTCQDKGWTIAGIPTLTVGLALATGGGIWLGTTLHKQGQIKQALKQKQAELKAHYQIGVTSISSGPGVVFHLQF